MATNLNAVFYFPLQSRDPAVQAAILAQLNAKYGSGVLPDAPKDMSKASSPFCFCYVSSHCHHFALEAYD